MLTVTWLSAVPSWSAICVCLGPWSRGPPRPPSPAGSSGLIRTSRGFCIDILVVRSLARHCLAHAMPCCLSKSDRAALPVRCHRHCLRSVRAEPLVIYLCSTKTGGPWLRHPRTDPLRQPRAAELNGMFMLLTWFRIFGLTWSATGVCSTACGWRGRSNDTSVV